MSYVCDLAQGQQLRLSNQGEKTAITLSRREENSAQTQGSSFTTGKWTGKPEVQQAGDRAVVTLHTEAGPVYLEVGDDHARLVSQEPDLDGAETVALSEAKGSAQPKMKPMEPLKPMEPMRPMKPMQPLT